jgi:hypothetical protein
MINVLSYGGGTQSTAIAALILRGEIAPPDVLIMADTGFEYDKTFKYFNGLIRPILERETKIKIVIAENDYLPPHGNRLLSHNSNTMLLGAYSNQTGNPAKLPGYCSGKWKVEPIERKLKKEFNITRKQYIKLIGFSLDESRRSAKILASQDGVKGLVCLPLIQKVPMTRTDCVSLIAEMGWPPAPRSRCYICPNQDDAEWKEVYFESPELFDKACAVEKKIQENDPCAWLHSSCKPLSEVDFFRAEPTLFDMGQFCDSGNCFS